MKQVLCLVQVMLIGCRSGEAVRDTGAGIHADMGFQPEVPLVSLLRLVHLRRSAVAVALATAVLG